MLLAIWRILLLEPQSEGVKSATITVVTMSLFSRKKNKALPRRRQIVEDNILRVEGENIASKNRQYSYRSGRTLTGSTSSRVATAGELGAELRSPRVYSHLLRRKRRHIGLALVATLFMCGLILFLMQQFIATPELKIAKNNVYTSGNTEYTNDYIETIDKYMSEHILERFAFSLDKDNFRKTMQAKYPEIDNIELDHLDGFGRVRFKLTPRTPIAVWDINNKKLFVDSKGVAFTKSYYDDPAVTIVDESGLPSDGKTVASNRFLGFIGKVIGYTAQRGYVVTKISLPRYTTRQIEVSLENNSYPIKMTFDRPAGEQVEDMVRVVQYTKDHNLSLELADVRVSGRAYYKTK